jgi:hypothetical protein
VEISLKKRRRNAAALVPAQVNTKVQATVQVDREAAVQNASGAAAAPAHDVSMQDMSRVSLRCSPSILAGSLAQGLCSWLPGRMPNGGQGSNTSRARRRTRLIILLGRCSWDLKLQRSRGQPAGSCQRTLPTQRSWVGLGCVAFQWLPSIARPLRARDLGVETGCKTRSARETAWHEGQGNTARRARGLGH